MTFDGKSVNTVTQQDLEALVENEVSESKILDFKSALPGNDENGKTNLAIDVVALANTSGGHIVYGVEERDGVAVELRGVPSNGLDRELLRLENTIRAKVHPYPVGLAFHVAPLQSGHVAVVLHVPRSWNGPHAVVNGDWLRFVGRHSRGNFTMDVGEVRAASLRSSELIDRIRAFRADRIARILADETPVKLPEGPRLLMHLVPFSAFDPDINVNPFQVAKTNQSVWASLHPIGMATTRVQHNFDGALRYGQDPSTYRPLSYVQLFRTGGIEAVDSTSLHGKTDSKEIPYRKYEDYSAVALRVYLSYLKESGVTLPVALMLTLIGVKGYEMEPPPNYGFGILDDAAPIDRDILIVPEILLEEFDGDARHILKPCYDAVWNAAGWPRSMNYDEQGNWRYV